MHSFAYTFVICKVPVRTFIRHKDRQYKTETETDRIKKI